MASRLNYGAFALYLQVHSQYFSAAHLQSVSEGGDFSRPFDATRDALVNTRPVQHEASVRLAHRQTSW
jgi:hypothetical protein